jgi:predicted nucleotidyltransferase
MKPELIPETLAPVFEKHAILSAYLFGSTVLHKNTALSDIDIAVYVSSPTEFSFNDKLKLHADCSRALKRNDIDLVIINQMKNLILQDEITRNGEVIYDIEPEQRMLFEVEIQHQTIDFKHQRKMNMGI